MPARFAAMVTALLLGALASAPSAHAEDPVLDGTYRLDFDGAHRMINGAASPTANTSATYSFTSSCGDSGCVADAVLLSATDTEPVSAHNPNLKLQFTDGSWQLSVPYDSTCAIGGGGDRNQLLSWSLIPQGGNDVLSGTRTVATVGGSCPGDAPGPLSQAMTATRIGKPAPGILPMP
jgi:serine/threonine-protein kinase